MRQRMRPAAWLGAVALLVAACSSTATTTSITETAAPTPVAAAFDLNAVKASFIDKCRDPDVIDALVAEQVKIADMTADGTILNVPTTLSPNARERAQSICRAFAFAHFDSDGKPLGYEVVEILATNGGTSGACSVD